MPRIQYNSRRVFASAFSLQSTLKTARPETGMEREMEEHIQMAGGGG